MLSLLLASHALGAEQWIQIVDGSLQMDTSCDENAARNTLKSLRQMRRFLQMAGPAQMQGQAPLTIIAFRSAAEFASYRAASGVAGYYQRGLNRDYIVLQNLAPDRTRVAMHEYTHFVIERAGLHLPRWLNEGLADLYSSLEADGPRALLGMPLEDRMLILKTRPWIDVASLVGSTDSSPYYHDHEQMLIAYSQGWLLAHMLVLSPAYATRFPEFLSAINQGRSATDCFESVYGRTVEQVSADLVDYYRGRLPVYSYPVNLTNIAAAIAVLPLSQRDLESTLADLLAVNPDQQDRAGAMLRDLSARYPDQPEPEAALGYIALRQNRRDEARQHFLSALERHSNDPEVLYYGARLQESAAGAVPDQIIQLFQRVLAIKPDHYEARLELGFFAAKNRRFALAASVLADGPPLRPEHVYPVAYTLAYCQVQMKELEQARQSAQAARRSALTGKEVEQVNHLLRYIDQEQRLLLANAPGPASVLSNGQ